MTLKIAIVTDNGERISAHFGHARYYKVFTIDENHIVAEEMIPRPHVHDHDHDHDHGHDHHHEHGHHDPWKMLQPITHCQVLIAGGMGTPAYQAAQASGLEVVLAGGDIHKAVEAYLRGELTSDLRRLHSPHQHHH